MTNNEITEIKMLEAIRQRFMFVDVETNFDGIKRLVISHKSSRTIEEYCNEDKSRMAELAFHYGGGNVQ